MASMTDSKSVDLSSNLSDPAILKETIVSDKDFLLTIKIPMKSLDDLSFRQEAKDLIKKLDISEDAEVKLQEIFDSKAPRKVNY